MVLGSVYKCPTCGKPQKGCVLDRMCYGCEKKYGTYENYIKEQKRKLDAILEKYSDDGYATKKTKEEVPQDWDEKRREWLRKIQRWD